MIIYLINRSHPIKPIYVNKIARYTLKPHLIPINKPRYKATFLLTINIKLYEYMKYGQYAKHGM